MHYACMCMHVHVWASMHESASENLCTELETINPIPAIVLD